MGPPLTQIMITEEVPSNTLSKKRICTKTSSKFQLHFPLQLRGRQVGMNAFMANESTKLKKRFYKRSTFVTHLPVPYFYSPSHGWAWEIEPDLWRIGLTKFATRMLGEMVDMGFETKQGDTVTHGEIIGWMEGFKAISDLYSLVDGHFECVNPNLEQDMTQISKDPYTKGWLYQAKGKLDQRCLNVEQYANLLDTTIDKILEQQANEEG